MESSFLKPQWQAIRNVKAALSQKELRNIEWVKVGPPSTNVEIKFKKKNDIVVYGNYGEVINNG